MYSMGVYITVIRGMLWQLHFIWHSLTTLNSCGPLGSGPIEDYLVEVAEWLQGKPRR